MSSVDRTASSATAFRLCTFRVCTFRLCTFCLCTFRLCTFRLCTFRLCTFRLRTGSTGSGDEKTGTGGWCVRLVIWEMPEESPSPHLPAQRSPTGSSTDGEQDRRTPEPAFSPKSASPAIPFISNSSNRKRRRTALHSTPSPTSPQPISAPSSAFTFIPAGVSVSRQDSTTGVPPQASTRLGNFITSPAHQSTFATPQPSIQAPRDKPSLATRIGSPQSDPHHHSIPHLASRLQSLARSTPPRLQSLVRSTSPRLQTLVRPDPLRLHNLVSPTCHAGRRLHDNHVSLGDFSPSRGDFSTTRRLTLRRWLDKEKMERNGTTRWMVWIHWMILIHWTTTRLGGEVI